LSPSIQIIPVEHLAIAFIPPLLMVGVMFAWSLRAGNALYGMARMLGQLLVIGYVLTFIFESDRALIVLAVLLVMVLASSWIALSNVRADRNRLFGHCILSIGLVGGINLAIMSAGVLRLDPWYEARYLVPLAGMVFANSMNSVSITAERLNAELERGEDWLKARSVALQAGLIPTINSLFAVGLVSLPGMMTGQILSGVSPLIAVRYQIMVMCMIFGSGGLAAVLFLLTSRRIFTKRTG
jgi:putative ABC transport system permease protein